MNLPWLSEAMDQLRQDTLTGRLAHAYIVSGPSGIGKTLFCQYFAKTLLCMDKTKGHSPCGSCGSCTTFENISNPDLLSIYPADAGKRISVDQIRAVNEFYSYKPHYGSYKITLIYPATSMNTNSANALLKILEEPPKGALIMLIANSAGHLLPTIRSRCLKLRIPQPNWDTMSMWLSDRLSISPSSLNNHPATLYGGPLEILKSFNLNNDKTSLFDELLDDLASLTEDNHNAVNIAKNYGNTEIREFLDTVELLTGTTILAIFGHPPSNLRLCKASFEKILCLSEKHNEAKLFKIADLIKTSRELLLRSQGVRAKDIIEEIFISFATGE
jgi:DNA polymerase-3 subunit delta'